VLLGERENSILSTPFVSMHEKLYRNGSNRDHRAFFEEDPIPQTIAHMDVSWLNRLAPEFEKPYMKELELFLSRERQAGAEVYPPFDQIFSAFCQMPFEGVEVVIMGQDPYHGEGQAHGLSFSVSKGVTPPPSLVNIFKELRDDLGLQIPSHGCLVDWARQGVLLLNATLTVRAGEPKSHYGKGWEQFTDRVVQLLCERKDPLVFLLWGKSALEKFEHIQGIGEDCPHLVLTAPHPSPFSAHTGFFGCKHFSKTNQFLKKVGKKEINWTIES
jgi:uracil-DNA glycosylase